MTTEGSRDDNDGVTYKATYRYGALFSQYSPAFNVYSCWKPIPKSWIELHRIKTNGSNP